MAVPGQRGGSPRPIRKMRKWGLSRHSGRRCYQRFRRKPGADRAARPDGTVCVLHDAIQAGGCVRIGRTGSGGAFEGAGVSESGGGKGGPGGAGVLTSPVREVGPGAG
jgi:hypothetical protein